jgi:hypothetical protein
MRGIHYAAASRFKHQPPAPSLRAKRSNPCHRAKEEWIASLRSQTPSPSRGAFGPGLANRFAQRKEGAGNAGCLLHPRSRVQKNNSKRTRAYRYSRSIPASLRNGFTAYAVLSSATNSSCHRHRRIEGFVRPGWARKTSANLTPATGARTTRFCRTPQHRSSSASSIAHEPKPTLRIQSAPDAAASTASHPNVSDDPDTPPREG